MSSDKKDKLSFPGFAKSLVRPVVRTTDALVKKGETLTKGAIRTVTHGVSGTVKVARGVVSDTTKVVKRTVSGSSKSKRKATGKPKRK